MLVLSILFLLLLLAAALTGGAIWRNRVAITAPPGAAARLAIYLTRNVVETRADHPFPELRTRELEQSAGDLVEIVRRACVSLGWELVGVDEERAAVRAQVRSPLLGFTDDVLAQVDALDHGGSRLRVRSGSRVGRGDLGANARHVLDLYQAVEAALAAESGGG